MIPLQSKASTPSLPLAAYNHNSPSPDFLSPHPLSRPSPSSFSSRLFFSATIPMLPYPTPPDHRYGDAANPAVPQGSSYWAPACPDGPQPAVTRETDDRHPHPRLRPNQLTPSPYASAATTFAPPQRDSYPPQAQDDCSGQYAYPAQPHFSSVNYAGPPYDFAEYPVAPSNTYHNGQFASQASTVTRYEYPPSDPAPFPQHPTYDPTGYFSADGQYCLPHDGQHQQGLASDSSGYIRYDDALDHYGPVGQHPVLPIPHSSSSSELENALVDIPRPSRNR
ncbi:hypothetical protein BC826DRAFT_1101988 [Russula brevipes]|nr:hypothetical protein BC826DRAFT_1101988 [Russula brevipes]